MSSPSSFGEPKQNSSNTSAFNTTVPQNGTGVNGYDMRNGGENSQFSFGDGTDKHENAPNKKFAYIRHRETVDGVPMVVKLAIKKSPEKNKLWVHTVHIENDTSVQGEEPNKGKQRPSTNTGASRYDSTSYQESQDDALDAESAMADGVSTVYNIGQIKETAAPEGEIISTIGSKARDATVSNTNIPQNGTGVNSYNMRNGGENSQFSFGDGTDIFGNAIDAPVVTGNEAAVAEAEQFAADADDITQKIRDTANRIDGFERPKLNEGYALENGVSIDSIRNSAENVNKNTVVDDIPDAESAMADGVSTVYNIGQIKETDAPEGSIISAIGSKAQGATVSNTTLSQNGFGVNSYDMRNGGENSQFIPTRTQSGF